MAVKKNVKNNQRPDRGANRKQGNAPGLSPEEESIILAKSLGLRPKSKQVLDELLNNPKISQTDAYLKYHKTTNRQVAANRASELVNKSSGRIYSERAVGKAKRKIVTLIDSANEQIAYKASADVLDRTEGKAVTKQEITQKTVTVKLDLEGLKLGAHYVTPELSSPE